MVAEVTDIKGIGPAKADTLADNGYESVEDVASADPDSLAEVDGVGDDRALEFIVGAENVLDEVEEAEEESEGEAFDLTPAEVSDEVEEAEEEEDVQSPSDEEEVAEDAAQDDEEDAEVEEEVDDEPTTFDVTIDFDNRRQYDTFHASVMRHHERHYNGNQPVADAMDKIINELDSFESVDYQLTEQELNSLHAAVSQLTTQYQGDNLISYMDELNPVLDQINEQRRTYLF